MGGELAQPACNEVPGVTGTDLLGVIVLCQLAQDGLDPPLGPDETSRGWLAAWRRNQVQARSGEFGLQDRNAVVAVAQHPTGEPVQELGGDGLISIVSGRKCGRSDHAGPADT